MAELAGILLGVTGPVQQVVDILKDLKERRRAVHTHQDLLDSLHTRFAQVSDTLNGIQESKIEGVTDDATRSQLRAMMEHVKEVVVGTVTNVKEVQSYAASRFNRFRSAKKHTELIDTVDRDAKDCDRYVSDILLLLAQADTHRAVLDLRQGASTDTARDNADMFRASFAVLKNDRIVQHDFESRRSDGAFETMEGRLKDLIVSSTDDRAVGAIAVGTGGVGKTCALLEIAQRADVRARFPGGTYFYRLGNNARLEDVISMLADFVRSSNGRDLAAKMRAEGDLHTVISDACNWFNGQVCLFVVDDIWETADMPRSIIQDLSRLGGSASGGGAGSRIAYSTRQTEVSDAAGGSTVRFEPREPLGDTARSMLFKAAQVDYKYAHDARFTSLVDDVLHFCAGLPFTLSLAGRLICKIQREWGAEIRVETFQICVEKLSGVGILNVRGESYFKLIQISIDHLDKGQDGHFSYTDAVESFCVLRKQDWVPINVCRHMWRVSSLDDAEEVTEILSTLGIVNIEYRKVEDCNIRGLRFHDHVHSYALWLAERSPDRRRWFKYVVHSYKTSFGALPDGVCWPAMLEEDGYAVQNICRVMLGAGLADEVARTLCTGQWVTKMMHTGQILQYEKDVKNWMGHTEGSDTTGIDDVRSALTSLTKIVRLGLRVCVGHPHVAWFQLYARLRSVQAPKIWMTTIMREAEVHAPRPFVQAKSACLKFPSDALLDNYCFQFRVRSVRWLCDESLAVYGDGGWNESRKFFFALHKPGVLAIVKELGTPGASVQASTGKTACLSPDGTIIYSGHNDGTIRTWDVKTGKQINAWPKQHNGPMNAICICSDGSRVASGSDDCTVRVWDVASGALVWDALTSNDGAVMCVSMSGDGSRVACGAMDCMLRVWDIASVAPVRDALTSNDSSVQSVSMTDRKSCIASASTSHDGAVRVWDVTFAIPQHICVQNMRFHNNHFVQCVCMSEDGSRVATGTAHHEVFVWEVASGLLVFDSRDDHSTTVRSVSMSDDGSRVASGSDDCEMRVWDVASNALLGIGSTDNDEGVTSVSMKGDGSRVAFGSNFGGLRVWDVASGETVCDKLNSRDEWLKSILSGDWDYCDYGLEHCDSDSGFSDSKFCDTRFWNVTSSETVCDGLTGHNCKMMSVSMSGDGSRAASGSRDGTVRIWDVASGAPVFEVRSFLYSYLESVSMSDDGSRVAIGTWQGTVHVRDVAAGSLLCHNCTYDNHAVMSVTISGDGSRVASGSTDGAVRVWDIASGGPVCDVLTGHDEQVESVRMSADGSRVASGSRDCTVRVWDVASGTLVCDALTGHDSWVTSVSISADGNRLVSISGYSSLRLWSAVRGKCEKVMPYDGGEDRELRAELRAEANAAARNFLCGRTRPALNIVDDCQVLLMAASVLLPVAAFDGVIRKICVSDDGTHVVAGFQNGTVAILHVLT